MRQNRRDDVAAIRDRYAVVAIRGTDGLVTGIRVSGREGGDGEEGEEGEFGGEGVDGEEHVAIEEALRGLGVL